MQTQQQIDAITVLKRIVDLVHFGATNEQISNVTGVDVVELEQIRATPQFLQMLGGKTAQELEQVKSLNDGWNSVEQRALKAVLSTMEWNADPEFALKAATMANKAQRRGIKTNRPIDFSDGEGGNAVIYMNATFINHLQQNVNFKLPATERTQVIDQKQQDFMPPHKVEEVLMPGEKEEKEDHIRKITGLQGSLDQ